MSSQKTAQGNWYLVLRDPSECSPSLGRQFDALSFGMDLKTGHAVEGMLVQHIYNSKPQGLHVVRGKSLKVQWLEAIEMKEMLEFYDIKTREKFRTSDWRIETKPSRLLGKLRYFAIAQVPGGVHEAWRIISEKFALEWLETVDEEEVHRD